jgi:hypothetical protein
MYISFIDQQWLRFDCRGSLSKLTLHAQLRLRQKSLTAAQVSTPRTPSRHLFLIRVAVLYSSIQRQRGRENHSSEASRYRRHHLLKNCSESNKQLLGCGVEKKFALASGLLKQFCSPPHRSSSNQPHPHLLDGSSDRRLGLPRPFTTGAAAEFCYSLDFTFGLVKL